MRLFKYAVLAAVVAGGWWVGNTMKDRKVDVKPAANLAGPAVVAAPPNQLIAPPVDPSLILPPPSDQGSMIDMPIGDIRSHFRDKAGLPEGKAQPSATAGTNALLKGEKVAPSEKAAATPTIELSVFAPTPAELGTEILIQIQATYKGGTSAIEATLHVELSLGLEHPAGFDIQSVVKLRPDVPQLAPIRLRGTAIGRQTITLSERSCPTATAVVSLDVHEAKKPTKDSESSPQPNGEVVGKPKTAMAVAYAEAKLSPAPSILQSEPKVNPLDVPPSPEPVKLPPTIRLPAPPEEPLPAPSPSPTVKRVLHRQIAMWMYVNQRDLRLNFDVTRQGSSGIKSVELWARRSSEQDYECVDCLVGDGEGAKPPFATRLWSEGNYELRLVFVSGSGVKSPAPSRNDLPDVYVCLDTTPPVVELLPPSADEPGVTKLRWKAFDTNLEEQPIRLHYSVDGETWHPVADANEWLPNTGEYAWKVPAGLPHELQLRVQARDKAGNIGEAHSHGKFSVDLVVPEGRISGMVESGPEPRDCRHWPEFPLKPRNGRENVPVNVLILTSQGIGDDPSTMGIERLLAAELLARLENEFLERKQKIQFVKNELLSNWKRSNVNWRHMSPFDIGRKFKVDYVIDLDVLALSIFEPHTKHEQLRGKATINVTAFDISKTQDDPPYDREFKFHWPLLEQINVADTSPSAFRARFIKRIVDDLVEPFIGAGFLLTTPHYLENPPQFPQDPDFPLPKELGYQEEALGLLGPVPEVLPAPRIVRRRTIPVHDGSIPVRDATPELLPEPRKIRVIIQTEEQERPALNPEFDQSRELVPLPKDERSPRYITLVQAMDIALERGSTITALPKDLGLFLEVVLPRNAAKSILGESESLLQIPRDCSSMWPKMPSS